MSTLKPELEVFLGHLEAAEILSSDDWETAQRLAQDAADLKTLVKRLHDQQLLTAWQIKQIAAGQQRLSMSRYLLLDKIGQGGMGTVYKAIERSGMRRLVALKVVNENALRKDSTRERFLREIQAISALNHPQIVTAYDAELIEEGFLLAMEYVPALNLSQWLKRHGPLPIAWTCEAIRQASLGLEHAHRHGIVHRDIKPGNLLAAAPDLETLPQVKLLDLGLARLTNPKLNAEEVTNSGVILGTIDYLSPEQARSTKHADARSDIFSLGATLFRLLTDEVPFPGETLAEKLIARASEHPVRINSIRPEVPEALDALVTSMLQPRPEDRPQSAEEVAKQLTAILHPAPKQTTKSEEFFDFSHRTASQPASDVRRKPPAGKLAAGAVFGVLCLVLALFWSFRGENPPIGQLQLKVDQPAAEIWVDGKRYAQSPTVREPFLLELPAGERVILVRKPGFGDQLRRVTIQPGELEELSIHLSEKDPLPEFVPAHLVPEGFSDRAVAKWALVRGGRIIVQFANGDRQYLRGVARALPEEEFAVIEIRLGGCGITDEAVPYLAGLSKLRVLELESNPISDEGVAELANHSALRELVLGRTSISGSAAETLRTLKQLERLELGNNEDITDETISQLRSLKQLEAFDVSDTRISEASIPIFAGWKNLRRLEVRSTRISRQEAQRLRVALPECRIDLFEARFSGDLLSENWDSVAGSIRAIDYQWATWQNYRARANRALRAESDGLNRALQPVPAFVDAEVAQTIYLSFTLRADPQKAGWFSFLLLNENEKDLGVGSEVNNFFFQYHGSRFCLLGDLGPTKPLERGKDYLVIVRLRFQPGEDTASVSLFPAGADASVVYDGFQVTSTPRISGQLHRVLVRLRDDTRVGNICFGDSLSEVGITRPSDSD